jgi:5,10-methylenetetrahydromethanopterin reductase
MPTPRRPLFVSPRFSTADNVRLRVRTAERLGVDQIWLDQLPDQGDAAIFAAEYLSAAPTVSIGTGVLPIYARHPVAMAQAAAALAELSNGRFILGLGYSHRLINEYVLGYQQGPPIAVMREYLTIVQAMITEGVVDYDGKYFTAHAQYAGPRQPVPTYLAALRPQMIRLAVRFGEGIVVWLCTPRYLEEQVMPAVQAACDEFGKPRDEFTVLAILPAYCGPEPEPCRARWNAHVMSYRLLPYYRHVLNAHGKPDPTELSLIGPPGEVQDRMAAFRATGCTPVPGPLATTADEFVRTIEAVYPA